MSATLAIELVRAALGTAFLLAAPLLAVALLVGLATSIIQTATGLQEQTLSFVPKLVAVGAALIALLPRMIAEATSFALHVLSLAGQVGQR